MSDSRDGNLSDSARAVHAQLHPVDPNAWPSPPPAPVLEQLTGHDLMALFPTQAPSQSISCNDIFKSQAREFLSRQEWPTPGEGRVQEPFVLIEEGSGPDTSPVPQTTEESRAYVPRQRRTPKVYHSSAHVAVPPGADLFLFQNDSKSKEKRVQTF